MNDFARAWLETRILENLKAVHKKGWRLGTYPAENILDYAKGEIDELKADPNDIEEMADVMLCLLAYCTRKEWSPDVLGRVMQKKLRARFPNAEELLKHSREDS